MNNWLKNIISFRFAVWTVIILISLIIVFHFLVLLQVLPFQIVWAGKLERVEEMYLFESISIAVNCILMFIVLVKGEMIHVKIPAKISNMILWIFVVVFALNTLGNLTSETNLETMVATPLTFILSILCGRIAIGR